MASKHICSFSHQDYICTSIKCISSSLTVLIEANNDKNKNTFIIPRDSHILKIHEQ